MADSTRADDTRRRPANDIAALPVALLVPLFEAPGAEPLALAARDLKLGSGGDCDVSIPFAELGVHAAHASLRWCGDGFELSSLAASAPTLVNGKPVTATSGMALRPGSTITLGHARYHFAGIGGMGPATGGNASDGEHARLLYGLATLSPELLVERALTLLTRVAPNATAALVASDSAAEFGAILPALSEKRFSKQRTRIEHVFACGETLQDDPEPTAAGGECVRIQPLFGPDGHPLAAAVLVWTCRDAAIIGAEIIAVSASLAHVGLAFRNAVLFSRLAALNRDLDQKVLERTAALEESRAQLVAQDRLATLGRLVAGIAHELNNPAGAIASWSRTLDRLFPNVRGADASLTRLFGSSPAIDVARAWLERAWVAANAAPPDSRRRRELELGWRHALESVRAPATDVVATKLARTGLEAAGLELSDPLAGTHASELATLMEEQYSFSRGLVSLGDCARNVARIVGGLKRYAHLDQSAAEVADVRPGIEAALSLLQSRIPPGVSVETRFEPVVAFMHRPGELIQVWTNLLDNALQAMGTTGTLIVCCREEAGDAVVEVTDSGVGVPAEIGARIFDLDVTTRGPGAGLGLGLAICRQIVEQNHGGKIGFKSRPGGTTFRVTLPMATTKKS